MYHVCEHADCLTKQVNQSSDASNFYLGGSQLEPLPGY